MGLAHLLFLTRIYWAGYEHGPAQYFKLLGLCRPLVFLSPARIGVYNNLLTSIYPTKSTMVSLRFPFLFSQPKRPCTISNATTSRSFSAATVVACSFAAGAAAFSGIAAAQKITNPKRSFLQNALDFLLPNHSSLPWGSLSLADTSSTVVESKTGMSFPSVVSESQRLLGIGLRRKSVLGLKNIDVYAFGNHIY